MREEHELTYYSIANSSPDTMHVVVKSGSDMHEELDMLPPVELPGCMPERLAMFAPDENGAFIAVSYYGPEGTTTVSHYLGLDGGYERCMPNGDGEIASYCGRMNHLGAVVYKGPADMHTRNALRVLQCVKFLGMLRYNNGEIQF